MLDLSRLFLEGWAARGWRSGIGNVVFVILKDETKDTQVGHFSLVLIKTLGWCLNYLRCLFLYH